MRFRSDPARDDAGVDHADVDAVDRASFDSVTQRLTRFAILHPHRVAVRFVGQKRDIGLDDASESLTYAELWHSAKSVADQLADRHVEAGHRVALLFPPGMQSIVAFLGCQMAGVVAMPTCYPRGGRFLDRLASIVDDADPAAIITDAATAERINPSDYGERPAGWIAVEDLLVDQKNASLIAEAHRDIASLNTVSGNHAAHDYAVGDCAAGDYAAGDHGSGDHAADYRGSGDDGLALIQYTSGSTGRPRGVCVSRANLRANLNAIVDRFGIRPSDDDLRVGEDPPAMTTAVATAPVTTAPVTTTLATAVNWLPFFHDMGLIGGILAPLYAGMTNVVMSPQTFLSDPAVWIETIARTGAVISGGPNFAFEHAARRVDVAELSRRLVHASADLSAWRLAFCGAEPIDADVLRRFHRTFAPIGLRRDVWLPCYGMAEATLMITGGGTSTSLTTRHIDRGTLAQGRLQIADPDRHDGSSDDRFREVVGCGVPVDGCQIRIVTDGDRLSQSIDNGDHDQDARDAVDGDAVDGDGTVVGEIWARGDMVAQHYWGSRQTHLRPGGWLATGDIGFIDDGMLFVTGRIKDTVIVRGRNYDPADLEQTAITATASIDAVVALDVPEFGFAMVVCPHRRIDPDRFDAIADQITDRIVDTHAIVPREIVFVTPAGVLRTSSGKLRRGEMAARYHDSQTPVRHRQTPVQPLDQTASSTVNASPTDSTVSDSAVADSAMADWIRGWIGRRRPNETIVDDSPLLTDEMDSMAAMEFLSELEKRSGLVLSPIDAIDHPTVGAFIAYVDDRLAETIHDSTGEPVNTESRPLVDQR